jgi:hypothetical protein
MKWIVKETSVENTVSEFGPFKNLISAARFTASHQLPWSEDFLSKIEIIKVSEDFKISPEVYYNPQKTKLGKYYEQPYQT